MKRALNALEPYRFILLLGCVAVLFAACFALAVASDAAHDSQVEASARTQAHILANSIAAALVFDDQDAIRQYTGALSANPEILAVAVYNDNGRRVAQFGQNLDPDRFTPGRRSDATGASIGVSVDVMQRGQKLGTVFLRQKTETLTTRLARYAGAAFILALAALLLSVIALDARALKRSNARLIDEMQQRESVESALRQSQKMEAVGRLTGGIAHDFNNMLAVISGNNELLLRKFPDADPTIIRFISSAQEATRRAAALTQRLLAFSRRQALDPRPTDAAKVILDMSDLLRRTLGETIAIQVSNAAGLWPALIDVGQLEIALVNLAVNARDAMPGGGKLSIATSNVHLDVAAAGGAEEAGPGDYVLVAVTDTGTGMPPEVLEQVFEPFFTTKDVGQGTGLGLSQVHGFVRQSGGHVVITSAVGEGTTVGLYLPRSRQDADNASPAASAAPLALIPKKVPKNLNVLVVDDERGVRDFAASALSELGYGVIKAENGDQAIRLVAGGLRPDILLTDVAMPGLSGRETADAIHAEVPDIQIIFMSGYAQTAIIHNGQLDPDTRLLIKPFSLDQLSRELEAARA